MTSDKNNSVALFFVYAGPKRDEASCKPTVMGRQQKLKGGSFMLAIPAPKHEGK